MIEKKVECKIKALWTNRGREFICAEMTDFLVEEGIAHEKTALYSPQSNGVAKRFNQTLLEGECAISFTANVPSMLWADLAVTAAYIRNCLPHHSNNWKFPYELLYEEKPEIKHL